MLRLHLHFPKYMLLFVVDAMCYVVQKSDALFVTDLFAIFFKPAPSLLQFFLV